jgi:predicted permease
VLILPLHLEPLSYCACVVLSACPTAGVTAMFAQMFHRDEETAAQMVTLSTLLSIVTLPIFAVLARQIAGF